MTRRVVWEGRHERLTVDEHPDGGVTLIRSTDLDSGPARSIVIPAEAVAQLAADLMGEGRDRRLVARDRRGDRMSLAAAKAMDDLAGKRR